jgi:hypothetical protein
MLRNPTVEGKKLVALLCLSSAFGFAESWSGALVDSKCYESAERNVNPTDTLIHVDRDQNQEIRYCSPGRKTKSFAVVQQDGTSFRLDSTGNAKAAELVRKTGRKAPLAVAITGELSRNTIKVDSISVPQ